MMTFRPYPFVLLFVMLLLPACTSVNVDMVRPDGEIRTPSFFDHGTFDEVLSTYVAEDGLVDYEGLKQSDALTPYLEALAVTDPSELSEQEQIAFWINAYNALTLKLIVDNYPTEGILRLSPRGIKGLDFLIPKVNTPFKVEVGYVGGEKQTPDNMEHGILRVNYDEPRIHFALVCAAMSCPPLRNEAYTGARLNEQLDDQGRTFLHDRSKNAIPLDATTIQISKIFDWFEGDFAEDDAGLQQYLAQYFDGDLKTQLEQGAFEIKHMSYDWTLNDQRKVDGKPEPVPAPATAQ
ncbi:MAG TPA: DUF547 domain-containing protein [Rhodothermales bacterium]|nr:DUF547 domain-containing protein [Rhodothermales bacterium]